MPKSIILNFSINASVDVDPIFKLSKILVIPYLIATLMSKNYPNPPAPAPVPSIKGNPSPRIHHPSFYFFPLPIPPSSGSTKKNPIMHKNRHRQKKSINAQIGRAHV